MIVSSKKAVIYPQVQALPKKRASTHSKSDTCDKQIACVFPQEQEDVTNRLKALQWILTTADDTYKLVRWRLTLSEF